jgi:parallel beta-helix repeat protein
MLSGFFYRLLRRGGNGQQKKARHPTVNLRVEVLEDRWVPSTLHVGSNETYHTIQAAVNAASSGDKILIDNGTYQEQVTVNKSIELKGQGNSVHIKAPTTLGSPTTSNPDAIVRVTGSSTNAKIDHLTIEGASSSGTQNLYYGVRVDGGAYADIKNNTITKIIDSSNSNLGVAIEVGNGGSDGTGAQVGQANIENNTIEKYQRAGIVINDTGSRADVKNNCISASSTYNPPSQTGVQVSFGAAAHIKNNSISGNSNGSDGTGVLLVSPGAFNTSDGDDYFVTVVKNNEISGNDYGIFGSSVVNTLSGQPASAKIKNNDISCNTYVGMEFDNSSQLSIKNNHVCHNGSDNTADGGIYLFNTTNSTIANNHCDGNDGSGIYVDATSTGNTFTHNHCHSNDDDPVAGNADVVDLSIGSGTAGTGNIWDDDHGSTFITISGDTVFNQ